jgi:hypothetical protein
MQHCVDIITSIHHFILFSFFLAFVLVFFCPFFCTSASSLFIMGDVPVPASSITLLAIVRRREEAHRVSDVLDSLGRLPTTLASGLNLDDEEDDEDDDNKGRASAVPSWQLVASSWS